MSCQIEGGVGIRLRTPCEPPGSGMRQPGYLRTIGRHAYQNVTEVQFLHTLPCNTCTRLEARCTRRKCWFVVSMHVRVASCLATRSPGPGGTMTRASGQLSAGISARRDRRAIILAWKVSHSRRFCCWSNFSASGWPQWPYLPAVGAQITRAEPADFRDAFEYWCLTAAAGDRVGSFNTHAD